MSTASASTDLPRVLERFGNRGDCAAQLEGEITGGRIDLPADVQRFSAALELVS